jgi:hypothetical protein
MLNFLSELFLDIFAFNVLPEIGKTFENKTRKHPTIAENISRIRKVASKVYGKDNVNAFLDTPYIDGLTPWQLTINGRSLEVLQKLKKP